MNEEKKSAEYEASAVSGGAENKSSGSRKLARILKWSGCLLLETLLLLAIGLYCVMFVVAKGPSPTAGRLFVRSVRETSAIGFLADLYFSEDEINEMISSGSVEYVETDTQLIEHDTSDHTVEPDAWGLIDEDGDGIILEPVKGEGYSGYMMVILDPSRVILSTRMEDYGYRGYTVAQHCEMNNAVAGINGGAFNDPSGNGNGSVPEGLVVYDGQQFNRAGVKQGFAGIDADHNLHVGCRNGKDAEDANIMYGASFGPVLLQNGEMTGYDTLESGLNPRTAIGQRSDGAFLFLVIDGRQVISLGCTYLDEAEIMLRYGAVNAVNLDGGSSTMLWYNGEYVNNCASVIGIRPIPTAFVVLPKQ